MIADLALRWVVTVLFALSAVECTIALVGSRGRPRTAVSLALHLAMAIGMAVMAWPRGAELPTTGPMLFFAAAAGWFLVSLLRSGASEARLLNCYHAAMMLAMAWMYAVMTGDALGRQTETTAEGGHGMHAMHMTGYETGSVAMSLEPAPKQPLWIPGINWLLTIGFVIAAAAWLYRYFAARQPSDTSPFVHFGTLCRAMMAGGMAVMFGVML